MINRKNKKVGLNIKKILNNIKITLTNYYGNKLKAIILMVLLLEMKQTLIQIWTLPLFLKGV